MRNGHRLKEVKMETIGNNERDWKEKNENQNEREREIRNSLRDWPSLIKIKQEYF